MDLDQEVCLCFHVTLRKLLAFVRVERPHRPSQLSNCLGAGTGCGWCRPFLRALFADAAQDMEAKPLPDPANYARHRQQYLAQQEAGKLPNTERPADDS